MSSITSQVVVARYPVMLPGDVTVWTAQELPDFVEYAPLGGITCSAADYSITELGDGDWTATSD